MDDRGSVRLTPQAVRMLGALRRLTGLSATGIASLAIFRLYQEFGLPVEVGVEDDEAGGDFLVDDVDLTGVAGDRLVAHTQSEQEKRERLELERALRERKKKRKKR